MHRTIAHVKPLNQFSDRQSSVSSLRFTSLSSRNTISFFPARSSSSSRLSWPSANLRCHLKTSAVPTKCSLFVYSIMFSVWVGGFPRSWQNLTITRISSRSDDDILTLVALVHPRNEYYYLKRTRRTNDIEFRHGVLCISTCNMA